MLIQIKDANDKTRFFNSDTVTTIDPGSDETLTEINFIGGKKIVVKEMMFKTVNMIRNKSKK